MRRNLKRVASLILSTLVVAQLIPTLAFAASDPASPLVKEPGYQNFPTYYNDSHHVDGQVTHPDVVVLDEAWNGYRYTVVEETSNSIVYSGNWIDDSNAAFSGGAAKYTDQPGAYVEYTFTGSGIRWYGQNDMNFGVASVYLDDTLVGTVDLNGHMNAKVLLFEKTGLSTGTHTIRVF